MYLWLTPVSIINVHKLLPAVVLDDTDEGILELWAKLENKLVGRFDGEAWCYEADMESPTERCEHVNGPPLVKSKDGVDALGELRADWRSREKGREGRKTRRFLREVTEINLFPGISCRVSGPDHFPQGLWVGECNLWRAGLVAMGCSALDLHRPALLLIGRRDTGEWIQYPEGSAEDFASSGVKCVVWTREPLSRKAQRLTKTCLLGMATVWPLELFYYGGERLQLVLAIAAPDAFKERKESICMTAQPFAANDSRRKSWVWPQKLKPCWEGISAKVHLGSIHS